MFTVLIPQSQKVNNKGNNYFETKTSQIQFPMILILFYMNGCETNIHYDTITTWRKKNHIIFFGTLNQIRHKIQYACCAWIFTTTTKTQKKKFAFTWQIFHYFLTPKKKYELQMYTDTSPHPHMRTNFMSLQAEKWNLIKSPKKKKE